MQMIAVDDVVCQAEDEYAESRRRRHAEALIKKPIMEASSTELGSRGALADPSRRSIKHPPLCDRRESSACRLRPAAIIASSRGPKVERVRGPSTHRFKAMWGCSRRGGRRLSAGAIHPAPRVSRAEMNPAERSAFRATLGLADSVTPMLLRKSPLDPKCGIPSFFSYHDHQSPANH